jgi:hypothetical protein
MDPHRAPVLIAPGPRPPVRDGVVAEDVFLTARWQTCTLCGRRASPLEQTLVTVNALALAALRCMRCRDHDPQLTALRAMLVQRYGADGKEES